MTIRRLIHLGFVLFAAPATSFGQAQDFSESLRRGRELAADQAEALETAVGDDADDVVSRAKLVAYYFGQSFQASEAQQAHQRHVLWLIEHQPASTLHESPETHIIEPANPDGYAAAKSLWLEVVKTHQEEAQVLGNAAQFFLLSDKDLAEELLLQAQALEPESAKWALQLAHVYQLQSHRAKGDVRRMLADKALAELERALPHLDEGDVYYRLADLAELAFESGADDKAEKYAQQLLDLSEEAENNWNTGNAIHHGNLILGRLALRGGDVDAAKAYLLKAGETTGSPQLNSFGPNMALAQELLERGERDVVLEYFGLCRKFWDREKLDDWAAEVTDGRVPEFGANLVY